MPFETDLVLKVVPGSTWELAEDLIYKHPVWGCIVVKKGFKTDLASIPRLFHRIVNPSRSGTRRPAVVHDHLYNGCRLPLTRKEADQLLYEALRECKTGWLLANLMYYAVRVGGASHWRASS